MNAQEAVEALVEHLRPMAANQPELTNPIAVAMSREMDGMFKMMARYVYVAGGYEAVAALIQETVDAKDPISPRGMLEALEAVIEFDRRTTSPKPIDE
jgi:hypothetical protein